MRVCDESGVCYEYAYDANNQMIHMHHTDGKTKLTIDYVYDNEDIYCAYGYSISIKSIEISII